MMQYRVQVSKQLSSNARGALKRFCDLRASKAWGAADRAAFVLRVLGNGVK